MSHILSNWKITATNGATSFTLVDLDQRLVDEPVWSLRKPLEIVPLPGTQVPFLRDLKNSVLTLSMSVIEQTALDSESRNNLMFWLTYWKNAGKIQLGIQDVGLILAGHLYYTANAHIEDFKTSMLVVASKARLVKHYTITLADLTYV